MTNKNKESKKEFDSADYFMNIEKNKKNNQCENQIVENTVSEDNEV